MPASADVSTKMSAANTTCFVRAGMGAEKAAEGRQGALRIACGRPVRFGLPVLDRGKRK